MAATKYQILYRYTNPNSNQFLLNDTDTEYRNVFEMYHDQHKIAIGLPEETLEALNEKSQLIIDGNSTANDNYNMLFKFTGTKRVNKKTWVEKSIGYVIRDKEAVRDLTSRAVDGDYSGKYLLFDGDTIENGTVVTRENPVTSTINITNEDSETGTYFKDDIELFNAITKKTIAKLVGEDTSAFTSAIGSWSDDVNGNKGVSGVNIRLGYNFSESIQSSIRYTLKIGTDVYGRPVYSYHTATNAILNAEWQNIQSNGGSAYSSATINPSQVETYEIPAHYEDVAEYPYVIRDTYERIEQSPWFILSTHASLTSALEKAKAIVKSVGIENVKLVKVVPTDQFIKIN